MQTSHKTIKIQGKKIGHGQPVFIIAEMSANHGQDYDKALAILHAAHEAGADAIKMQTYTPDTMTLDSDAPPFIIKGTIWDGQKLHALYSEACMPWEWQPLIKKEAEKLGMICFSTPFDASSVDFLSKHNFSTYKVASFEVVDIPLLKRIGLEKKPVIMSTGMASTEEIKEAIETLTQAGAPEIALLHCISAYPSPPESMRLKNIAELAKRFTLPVGLSDHSVNSVAAIASVTLGASIIEKHLTLSRKEEGPDSTFSIEPNEFASLVSDIRQLEKALAETGPRPLEETPSRAFRRSLFATKDIAAGEHFTEDNIKSLRPADGLHPRYFEFLTTQSASVAIAKGTPLSREHVEGELQINTNENKQ